MPVGVVEASRRSTTAFLANGRWTARTLSQTGVNMAVRTSESLLVCTIIGENLCGSCSCLFFLCFSPLFRSSSLSLFSSPLHHQPSHHHLPSSISFLPLLSLLLSDSLQPSPAATPLCSRRMRRDIFKSIMRKEKNSPAHAPLHLSCLREGARKGAPEVLRARHAVPARVHKYRPACAERTGSRNSCFGTEQALICKPNVGAIGEAR